MPLGRWLKLLRRFGLAEASGDNCLQLLHDGPVKGLFSMENPVHLDPNGIALF
jgi:hypothetical protein